MSADKQSNVWRHAGLDNRRFAHTINNVPESEYSSENIFSDHPKSTNSPIKNERAISSAPVKGSKRRRTKLKISDHSKDEDERDSSANSRYESVSKNKKIENIGTVRKVDEFSINTKNDENRESESSERNESSKRGKKRKSKKQRKEKRVLDSNRTDNETNDEDGRSSERDLSQTRLKKTRADIPRKARKKRHRSKGEPSAKTDVNQEKELPITEILRKAQENPKPRYEEPLPFPTLSTDRIYVQRRNGFSAVKITNERNKGIFGRRPPREKRPPLYPIKVAIVAQNIWGSTGVIHQGLLAGMALMHLLLMQTFFRHSPDFLQDYSVVSELYTSIFSYLVTMCVISVLDRFDLGQLDIEHFREIYTEHSRSFFVVPLYMGTFLLHQAGLFVDDNISLLGYSSNTTELENNSTSIIAAEDLATWEKVTLAKDSLAVLAWIFVALGPREDMFFAHLSSMEKYVDVAENSA